MDRFTPDGVRRARRRVGLTVVLAAMSLAASNAAFAGAPVSHDAGSGGVFLAAAGGGHLAPHAAVPRNAGGKDPDPNVFGVDGKVGVHGTSTSDDLFSGISVTPEGKILASGLSGEADGSTVGVVTRRNADGSPDTTFGDGNGVALVRGIDAQAIDVRPTADGGVVGSGLTTGSNNTLDVAVFRLTPAGRPDPAFGTSGNGVAIFHDRAQNFGGTQLAVQPDGKFVVVGQNCVVDCDVSARRVLPDGTLDPTFGQGGETIVDLGCCDEANAVAIQPDGKIVLAGDANFDPEIVHPVGIAIRLDRDGSLDPSFVGDGTSGDVPAGVVKLPTEGFSTTLFGVALQSNGKIDMVGYTKISAAIARNTVVFQLLNNGRLDTTFNRNGVAVVSNPGSDQGFGIGVQRDNSVVISSFQSQAEDTVTDSFLNRLTPSGRLDPTFGTDGTVVIHNLEASFAFGLAIQSDGKIVTAGRRGGFNAVDSIATIDRFDPDGSYDTAG